MSARKDGRTPKPVAPIADVAAALTLRETNLLRYHPVMIAISKARAARYLIGLADDENLPAHDACLTPEQRIEHIEWIKSFALEAPRFRAR